MTDCLFCRIAAGEIPSKKVYDDPNVYAFHDIAPKAPTHVLVIPKRHIGRLAEAGAEDRELLGEVVSRAAAIARDLGLEHYRLVQGTAGTERDADGRETDLFAGTR